MRPRKMKLGSISVITRTAKIAQDGLRREAPAKEPGLSSARDYKEGRSPELLAPFEAHWPERRDDQVQGEQAPDEAGARYIDQRELRRAGALDGVHQREAQRGVWQVLAGQDELRRVRRKEHRGEPVLLPLRGPFQTQEEIPRRARTDQAGRAD